MSGWVTGIGLVLGAGISADASNSANHQARVIQEQNEAVAREQLRIQEEAVRTQEAVARESAALAAGAAAAQTAALRETADAALRDAQNTGKATAQQKATETNLEAQRRLIIENAKTSAEDDSAKAPEVDVATTDEAPARRRRAYTAPNSALRI